MAAAVAVAVWCSPKGPRFQQGLGILGFSWDPGFELDLPLMFRRLRVWGSTFSLGAVAGFRA